MNELQVTLGNILSQLDNLIAEVIDSDDLDPDLGAEVMTQLDDAEEALTKARSLCDTGS